MTDQSRLDAIHAAALVCDADGWIVAVNARCVALFGGDAALLCGGALASLFPNERTVHDRLRRAAGDSIRLQGRRLTGVAVYVEAEAAAAADGSLTCRLWDVLGGASAPAASVTAARTR
jgi:PAS domain-containing protein